MTPPVHSGEPETPQTDSGKRLLDTLAPVRTEMAAADLNRRAALVRREKFEDAILAIEREAAALAPGAGLDVERLTRQVRQLPVWSPHPDIRDRITGNLVKENDVIALLRVEYERLGATPDPRPETPK